jgi:hypothetical protein
VKGWLRHRLVIKSRVCYIKSSCYLAIRVTWENEEKIKGAKTGTIKNTRNSSAIRN